jgi:cytochrome c peroxidase
MRKRLRWVFGTAFAVIAIATVAWAAVLTPSEQLGKSIFFDENLSINQNQACAACHAPETGFVGPDSEINAHGAVYEGSIAGRFGDRKPPSASYATLSPIFFFSEKEGLWIGGNFWDGRATGEKLANPAADQAQGPFLNPFEQGLPDNACVVYRVCNPVNPDDYPVTMEEVWGDEACGINWPADVDAVCGQEGMTVMLSPPDLDRVEMSYDEIALSIADYEDSAEVNQFDSKWDRSRGGQARLNKRERQGFAIFKGKGKCKLCHIINGQKPVLTDFTFDNLGVPKNLENPIYDRIPDFIDRGLGGFLENEGYPPEVFEPELGKQKVPTLRNVGKGTIGSFVQAYGHNGYFKSLKEIVHFYNTRDVLRTCDGPDDPGERIDCWPPPEVPMNVNTDELGDLGLTDAEENALVDFLLTLQDP